MLKRFGTQAFRPGLTSAAPPALVQAAIEWRRRQGEPNTGEVKKTEGELS